MNLRLTKEQEMMKKMAGQLAAKEIAPLAAEIDDTGQFPRDVMIKMGEVGLFDILIPPPFGRAKGDSLDFMLAVEEIAAASASVGLSFVTSMGVAFAILTWGSDEQKRKYLPALASGKKLGAFAVTEPSGGTNWQMTLHTRATANSDHYIVNGSKCFISNASEADVYIVLVKTDATKGPQSISALIIEKDTPGFSFGKLEEMFGLRGESTGELIFEDCRVPKENLLGEEGNAMKITSAFAALSCTGHAAIATGIARAALEASVKYTQERIVVQPKALADFGNVQRTIADMTVAVEAARLITYRAAFPKVQEKPNPLVFMAATFSNEVAIDVTDKAVGLYGGYGGTTDFPVERYFRDAKTLSLHKTFDHVKATAGKMLLGIQVSS